MPLDLDETWMVAAGKRLKNCAARLSLELHCYTVNYGDFIVKTANSKAKVVCHKLNLPDDGSELSIILNAIKEQDRDTRHACAKAVIKGAFWNDTADCDVIRASFAHAACMNVEAV